MTFSSDPALNTNQLPISLDVDPEEKDYQSILLLYLRRIANAMNTKESGLYLIQETAPFAQWFSPLPSTATTANTQQQNRNAYRLTMDLVALNGAPIPAGVVTTIPLTADTNPPEISGYLYPVQGFGGAIDDTGVSYFLNDLNISVTYTSSTNTITIVNNVASNLTWCVWVMEYLKN